MVIKVTNQCGMGCSHCIEDSRPKTGQHMGLDLFEEALDFTARMEVFARLAGYCCVLLSGGEPTENPDIIQMIKKVDQRGWIPLLISNGSWLGDKDLRNAILRSSRTLLVQVTSDPRFYPTLTPYWSLDPRIGFVNSLTAITPLGRASVSSHRGVPLLRAPGSFNFRSFCHSTKDARVAIAMLRKRSMEGKGGHCTPSVTYQGRVMAGESRLCADVGSVRSSWEEITANVLQMGSCNRCTLEANLKDHERRAIGLQPTQQPPVNDSTG